jgi:hypothetical protein
MATPNHCCSDWVQFILEDNLGYPHDFGQLHWKNHSLAVRLVLSPGPNLATATAHRPPTHLDDGAKSRPCPPTWRAAVSNATADVWWQKFKMPHLYSSMIFSAINIYRGFSIAMFDYQRVRELGWIWDVTTVTTYNWKCSKGSADQLRLVSQREYGIRATKGAMKLVTSYNWGYRWRQWENAWNLIVYLLDNKKHTTSHTPQNQSNTASRMFFN